MNETTETFMCLTCGMETEIDLADASGRSEESANDAHMAHDGAHHPNWLNEAGGEIQSPDERRTALGIELDIEPWW